MYEKDLDLMIFDATISSILRCTYILPIVNLTSIQRYNWFWERLVRHYPSIADLSFSQFASLDEIVTEKQLSDEDVTREALEAAKPRESQDECVEESEPEDNEIFVMEPKLLSPLQASEYVRALSDFVMSSKLKSRGQESRSSFAL